MPQCVLYLLARLNQKRAEYYRNMLEYWPFFACTHKEIDIAIMLLEEVFFCLIWNGKKNKLEFFSIYTHQQNVIFASAYLIAST